MDRYIRGPVRFLVLIVIARAFLFDLIDPSVQARAYFDVNTTGTIVLIWFLLMTTNLIRDALKNRSKERGDEIFAIIIRPVANGVKFIVIAIPLLVWLDNMGYNITTVLAGLGIGSIALALAAQKSVEDLFGAITLYSSRPVNIGDFFRFGDKMGIVEEIGLRFTRVRTLGNSVLVVPNAKLASAEIENFTQRKKMWYHPVVRLANTTTPDQINKIIEDIHTALISHPKVEKEKARVRFVGFGEYSLNLEIFSYIKTTDYAEFLKFGEELNLQLMDVVRKNGARIAVPTHRNIIENAPART
jgi:MscS family membrane protein